MKTRAAARLLQIPGVELCFQQSFFREFTVRTPLPASQLLPKLARRGFNVGPSLHSLCPPGVPQPEHCFLVAVTEKRTQTQIDGLAAALREALNSGHE